MTYDPDAFDRDLQAERRHGTTTSYTYWRCRCDRCREAHREAVKAWRRRKQ